jgi:hypothetical protein
LSARERVSAASLELATLGKSLAREHGDGTDAADMTRTDHQIAAPNTAQPRWPGSRARIGLASASLATLAVLVAACNSADHGTPQADTTTSAAEIPIVLAIRSVDLDRCRFGEEHICGVWHGEDADWLVSRWPGTVNHLSILNLGDQRVVAGAWVLPGYTIHPAGLAQMAESTEFGGDQARPELLGDGLTHRR